jgi:hypothetical protein
MSLLSTTRRKKNKHAVRQACSLVLLLFYIIGTSEINVFHHLSHSYRHQSTHSVEQEKDPCHRAIYHGDHQNGCKHHSHIVKKDKCGTCSIIAHKTQILAPGLEIPSIQFRLCNFDLYASTTLSSSQTLLPSRAPPGLIPSA